MVITWHTRQEHRKTTKKECKGEGRVKSFLLFRREISRAKEAGRYRVASVITNGAAKKRHE